MLMQSMITRVLVVLFASFLLAGSVIAEPFPSEEQQQKSLIEVSDAVVAATGYDNRSLVLTAKGVQILVTLVNNNLMSKTADEREIEAGRIVTEISRTIFNKSGFKEIQIIQVDYVEREGADGHARMIDSLEFRRDPHGHFQHHLS
jgi:hypothetical protein